MTRARRFGEDTPFGKWLRSQPELSSRKGFDAENLDYIWHHYLDGRLMLLEEKRYGARQSSAQRDTHSIIDEALRIACAQPDGPRNERGKKIRYYGYHIIQFENTNPEDGWTRIDGREVTKEDLVRFLKFEWMP